MSESTNWKLDLYKANNMSYAQVLKIAVKHKTANARTDNSMNAKVRNIIKKHDSVMGSRLHCPGGKAPNRHYSINGVLPLSNLICIYPSPLNSM